MTTRALAGRLKSQHFAPGCVAWGPGRGIGTSACLVLRDPGRSAVRDGAPSPETTRCVHTVGRVTGAGRRDGSMEAAGGAPVPVAGGQHSGPTRHSQPPSDTNCCPRRRWHLGEERFASVTRGSCFWSRVSAGGRRLRRASPGSSVPRACRGGRVSTVSVFRGKPLFLASRPSSLTVAGAARAPVVAPSGPHCPEPGPSVGACGHHAQL